MLWFGFQRQNYLMYFAIVGDWVVFLHFHQQQNLCNGMLTEPYVAIFVEGSHLFTHYSSCITGDLMENNGTNSGEKWGVAEDVHHRLMS